MRRRLLMLLVAGCSSVGRTVIDGAPGPDGPMSPVNPLAPAVTRGQTFFGFAERFNRYYTDGTYAPSKTTYVSPTGGGTGASPGDPTSVTAAIAAVQPGGRITFLRGTYNGCFELSGQSGTYDAPIVLYAERNGDQTRGVTINCCATGRRTCINLEGANYVAVDGFILNGGRYGVRAVGLGTPANPYESSAHQRGVAVLNNDSSGQSADPFFTGASDWAVFEGNLAHEVGSDDGHGIYLSNGSDWNIVRRNDIWSCPHSAAFQINADPLSTCNDVGLPAYTDPACYGPAENGQGQGVSEYILYEANTIHDVYSTANFTSVRNSIMRNNIFAFANHHGVSWWQEVCSSGGCDPNFGSKNNKIHHNLFVNSNGGQIVQLINQAVGNDFRNNVVISVSSNGTPSAGTVLVEVDASSQSTAFAGNFYVSGSFDGHTLQPSETRVTTFDPTWVSAFPTNRIGKAADYKPNAGAPWLNRAPPPPESPNDYAGRLRANPADMGPFEAD